MEYFQAIYRIRTPVARGARFRISHHRSEKMPKKLRKVESPGKARP